MQRLNLDTFKLPIGTISCASFANTLLHVEISADDKPSLIRSQKRMQTLVGRHYGQVEYQNVVNNDIRLRFDEYLQGEHSAFKSLKYKLKGTSFQQKVWEALLTIPFGETSYYGALAEKIGKAKAVRALGTANGKNPLAIIIPCHRVIAKDGTIGGYAGGVDVKRKLLSHEGLDLKV